MSTESASSLSRIARNFLYTLFYFNLFLKKKKKKGKNVWYKKSEKVVRKSEKKIVL
jgi:hypothetical protein